jgi:hypothetical protein
MDVHKTGNLCESSSNEGLGTLAMIGTVKYMSQRKMIRNYKVDFKFSELFRAKKFRINFRY